MNFGGTIRINRIGVCIIFGTFVLFVLYYMNTSSSDGNQLTGSVKNNVNLKELLVAAITASIKGGKEVVSVQKSSHLDEKSKGNTKEGVNVPVTKADMNSHCVMYYGLTRIFPEIKIVSEEHIKEAECTNLSFPDDSDVVPDVPKYGDLYVPPEDITVWIDPLDATKEFTEKLNMYVTTMVCVAVKGKPVIGVIHKPFEPHGPNQTYWAWSGKGASDNLSKTKAPSNVTVKIIVSRSHAGEVKNLSEQAFGKSTEVIPAGGAGYKALEVALGGASAYVHTTNIQKWDICAGDAIIQSLEGGKMTTLSNTPLDYSSPDASLNDQGLLATMSNHSYYLEKINSVRKI